MQSGISVSADLHREFTTFLSDPSLFCLPVTISSDEQLTPEQSLPFPSNATSSTNQFITSLPSLSPLLEPSSPIYLILRRTTSTSDDPSIIAVTYIPSTSPVRAKTLFASTRATLVRGLGSEKFAGTVFAADREDVLKEESWAERDADENAAKGDAGADGSANREDLMGEQERGLEAVKKAEGDARIMSARRDIAGTRDKMPYEADEKILAAYKALEDEGTVVTMNIAMPSEALSVNSTEFNIAPSALASLIPDEKPQYTFYRYPNSTALLFIYTCPPNTPIKDRMIHATSRKAVQTLAEQNGVQVSHKLEASSNDEITAQRLEEEVNPPREQASKPAFARPRRPGR